MLKIYSFLGGGGGGNVARRGLNVMETKAITKTEKLNLLQWGLEYRTLENRIHSNTERFLVLYWDVRFPNGPFENRIFKMANLGQVVLYIRKKLYLYKTTQLKAAIFLFFLTIRKPNFSFGFRMVKKKKKKMAALAQTIL